MDKSYLDKFKYGRTSLDEDFRKRPGKSPRKFDYLERKYEEPRRYDSALAAGKYDTDTSKASIYELESRLAAREAKISQLEHELRAANDIEQAQAKTLKSLAERLEEGDREAREAVADKRKAEATVQTLHSDNRQLQDRVLELEERLRRSLEGRESRAAAGREAEEAYEELRRLLLLTLFPDAPDLRSHDALVRRLKDYASEQLETKQRWRKVEESLEAADEEVRRNRETIRQLLGDVAAAKKFTATTEVLKEERDFAVRHEEGYRSELGRMEERLLDARRQWEEAAYEARQHQAKLGEADAAAKKQEMEVAVLAQEFKAFRETLATMLTESFYPIPPTEDAIKDRVRKLMAAQKDVGTVSRQLEEKMAEVTGQLEEQAELHKRAVTRAKKAEAELEALRERLAGMEGELTATDILHSGLKGDKRRYEELLAELARVMRMEEIVGGLKGVEISGDSILARAEQLARSEADTYSRTRSARSLGPERRVRELEKDVGDRNMQISILTRKLRAAEKDLTHRAEHDLEEVLEKSLRGQRGVEKLTAKLHEAKTTIASMKKELVENQALRITVDELKRRLQETERELEKAKANRSEQSRRLHELRSTKEELEEESHKGRRVTESTLQSLSAQLKRAKKELEDCQRREKQLSDLRVVIARMLGLDVSSLAVPDYEIISRLEMTIQGQYASIVAGGAEWKGRGKGREKDAVQRGYSSERQRMKSRNSSPSTSRWK